MEGAALAAPFSCGLRLGSSNASFPREPEITSLLRARRVGDMNDNQHIATSELDLRGVICPYNFVKTKLKLETMKEGEILSVLLDDGDPIRNVPRSVENEGHTVLAQERVEQAYRLLIRREDSD